MYVCIVITYNRVWINRVRLPILLVVSWTGKNNIPLSPCVPENLVSRDGFSRPVPRQPVHLSILRLNMVLTYGIPPEFRGGVHLWNRHTPSGQSRVYRVTQLRTDGVHCRESAGTGPVNIKVVPNECCLGRCHHGPINIRLSFPHPLLVWSGHVESTGGKSMQQNGGFLHDIILLAQCYYHRGTQFYATFLCFFVFFPPSLQPIMIPRKCFDIFFPGLGGAQKV